MSLSADSPANETHSTNQAHPWQSLQTAAAQRMRCRPHGTPVTLSRAARHRAEVRHTTLEAPGPVRRGRSEGFDTCLHRNHFFTP